VESAIFLFTRQVLAFFRVNPAKSFNQTDFFNRSASFYQSSGQPRVNPGKQERGGRKKNQNIGEFAFRGILQPTTPVVVLRYRLCVCARVPFACKPSVNLLEYMYSPPFFFFFSFLLLSVLAEFF